MKYWKGIKTKEGQWGTYNDNGFVPDSVETTKEDYEVHIIIPTEQIKPLTDIEKLIIWAKKQGVI